MTRSPVRLVQAQKAISGITLRAFDNVRSLNPLQPKKAIFPIVVNELGNIRDPLNPEHFKKALLPIVSSLFDSVRVPLNPVQESKALLPISVTELGMTRSPVRLFLL